MIGRYTEMYTLFSSIVGLWDPQAPINLQYNFQNVDLFRIIFRVGVISGSIIFGVAFLVVARKIEAGKIKDYFTIAAIGAMMISITLGPSGLQETFGVAGRTLMLLASFMLCAGFYLTAVHMAQDARLRKVIKASAGSKVFWGYGCCSAWARNRKEGFRYHRKGKRDYQRTDRHTTIIRTKRCKDVFG
jgi:hypothetical protein